jgi:sugar phosphate permease
MATAYEKKFLAHQIVIFTTLFVGYAFYAYNRKSVSAAMPTLIAEGLDKSQAGENHVL